MRVCIIGSKNLNHLTLISIYTRIFDRHRIPYDIVYLDIEGKDETYYGNAEVHKYSIDLKKDNCLLARIANKVLYKKYYLYVTKKIKQNKYDFLVLWGDETAALLADFLKKRPGICYSVNIRDIWSLDDDQHTRKVFSAINHSCFTTVSSDGFLRHLPTSKYLFVHSANKDFLGGGVCNRVKKDSKAPIVITSIGTFRNDDYNKRLVDVFSNDNRFLLKFIGQGSNRIQKYILEKGYMNIKCTDFFKPEETLNLLEDADIISCAYGAENEAEITKLPIRFYYAVYLNTPILATEGTWIEKTGKDLGISISIPASTADLDSSIANKVYQEFLLYNQQNNQNRLDDYKKEIDDSHIKLEKELLSILT